ncbi:MAG: hypothetical protein ACT6RF_12835 [Allorhizobium sp.]|uniref:hypothetical protein n=1 Tax=Allorhizobium sp. TaxID=633478 RepID=UPI004034C412
MVTSFAAPECQSAIISKAMLDTKTAIEANAATSRRISVISVSLSLYVFSLFFSCSNVNLKKPKPRWNKFHQGAAASGKGKEKRD